MGTTIPDWLVPDADGAALLLLCLRQSRGRTVPGLTPSDLIDIAAVNGLHFDGAYQQGVVFHLIGALSEFGKLGVVFIAPSHERAEALHRPSAQPKCSTKKVEQPSHSYGH